jgi:hypothetical protein
MRLLPISLILALVLLTGCGDLPSVEALATSENTVFDPALVGAWSSGDAVVISQPNDDKKSYSISWLGVDGSERPRIVRMEARLAQVGDERILDLTSSDPGAFTIPCHVFLRVHSVAEGLDVRFVDSAWIQDRARENSLDSFVQDNHPVITAATSRLASFLLQFGLDQRAQNGPMVLRPMKQN